MGDLNTSSGTYLSIGTTLADISADTFTEVGEVTSIPELGRVYRVATHNPLKERGDVFLKAGFSDGANVAIPMAMDIGDAGQIAVAAALDSDFDYNFKITMNDEVPAKATTVTISQASPGVVTWTAHGLAVNTPVKFTTTGALPAGLTAGTTYYVKTVASADTFTVSATKGGSAINTSDAGSGTHTGMTVPEPSTITFKAKLLSFPINIGNGEQVTGRTMNIALKSNSLTITGRLPLTSPA